MFHGFWCHVWVYITSAPYHFAQRAGCFRIVLLIELENFACYKSKIGGICFENSRRQDAMIVIAGCTLFGDPISVEQGCGFTAQLFFIFLWSVMTLVKRLTGDRVWSIQMGISRRVGHKANIMITDDNLTILELQILAMYDTISILWLFRGVLSTGWHSNFASFCPSTNCQTLNPW